jgi:hypothetical protein
MTDSRAAVGFDRLPWLTDEPEPAPAASKRRVGELGGWAVAATLLVAGASYWLGTRTAVDRPDQVSVGHPGSVATVPLPQPRSTPSDREVSLPATAPEVAPPRARTIDVPRAAHEQASGPKPTTPAESSESQETAETAQPDTAAAATTQPVTAPRAPVQAPPVVRPQPLTLWPSRVSHGASGRLVQIGAFGSRYQAKLGWRYMTRSYPAVKRLPAVVVETRNSRGRHFYRFQIGTTSQAHSEVLCQRMERIRLSCAVVGLPWKPRGVER